MMNLLTDQIYDIIERKVFDFEPVRALYKAFAGPIDDGDARTDRASIEDTTLFKQYIYNLLLLYEANVKKIFIRMFQEALASHDEARIEDKIISTLIDLKDIAPKAFKGNVTFVTMPRAGKASLVFYEPADAAEIAREAAIFREPYVRRVASIRQFLAELGPDFAVSELLPKPSPKGTSVFIVHGRNEGVKNEVARFVSQMGLTPVILHEQENESSSTIIEKFEHHSQTTYAIVLLTDDDQGKAVTDDTLRLRARQNVILEMGYFIGLLGRKNVCCVLNNSQLEIPSDISGVLYIPFGGNWKIDLLKELRKAGFKIDANRMFEPN